jgi:FkbM family methyltransferase
VADDLRRRRQVAVEARDTPPHPVFEPYAPWTGEVEAGWDVNFLGVRTRVAFFSLMEQLGDYSAPRSIEAERPVPNEEYFEWIALLEAVGEAEGSFVMVELGAGWGRWIVNGVAALRLRHPLPYHVVGVEAEPTHFRWMQQHLEDNGVEPGCATLIEAAVADEDGSVWFTVGSPADWYGQAIVGPPSQGERTRIRRTLDALFGRRRSQPDMPTVQRVRAVSLVSVLKNIARADLLDLDIQGSEAAVLESAADALAAKVKRTCVGTHGPENEKRLRELFGGLGWRCAYDYPSNGISDTPWGRIMFEDGVQVWANPRL